MEEIREQILSGERSLFASCDLKISDCVFENGESPLKESRNIELDGTMFRWKYPLWYCNNVKVRDCTWFEMARAGVWYTEHFEAADSFIQAPKNFRRCHDLTLSDIVFTNAEETLWNCEDIKLSNITARGDYFAMNCTNIEADNLKLDGNYSFDGVKNAVIRNSRLLSKDAFWNSENITVYDSFISGEYLGWNSRNLTLIGCTIESLQGLCYIDNLVMKDCKLIDTTLAFEYSSVDASITSTVGSVFNPKEGTIKAPAIRELIVEKDIACPGKTRIICDAIDKVSSRPEWKGDMP